VGGGLASKCATGQHGCIKSFSDTSISLVAPDLPVGDYFIAGAAGNPPQGVDLLLNNMFSYKPVVYSASPVGGQAGTTVTVKGANFGTGSTVIVKFHGTCCGGSDVSVSAKCSGTQVGCFTTASTTSAITFKAPAITQQ